MQPSIRQYPLVLSLLLLLFTSPLSSPASEAPTPSAGPLNISSLMAKKGCRTFAGLLASSSDAASSFSSAFIGGLTTFCPVDQALNPFLPRFKNLTADEKVSLLLFHAVPIYYSIQTLKTNNGVFNTLATDGTARNFNFTVQNDGDVVTLRTKLSTAKIVGTIIEEEPLAVYQIDAVLEPTELFRPSEAPAPAPAPAPAAAPETVADSPKAWKKKPTPVATEMPAAGPGGDPADQRAANHHSAASCRWEVAAVAAAAAVALLSPLIVIF
ncbi:Fasciclin-like arabinogalactan protein 2 [Apostasia shenzhenica]|uniref:Fasciclin-like arabinogalactan protein 2 n=1 Tax=Apostasia shenzhenica TaxID=1088818 RepID=A0A2H9ZSR8_9ASPA|nr:Fasciclin-like arabinogalactan protein 2 [Apostasia shenzhenica]